MKFKTTAIALAVAGTVAVPMAAQADLYASARIGLASVDTGGVSELSIGGVSSRFGMRSETDLGNGMTGFGRYEFSVNTEESGADSVVGGRHAYVGLKGDFGSMTLGRTYHTFYNHIIGPYDIPWVGSNKYSAATVNGRSAEAVTYAGSVGAVSWGATGYFNVDATPTTGEEGLNGFELAGTFGIGDMNLGVGIQDIEADAPNDIESVMGITLSGIGLGDASMAVSFQTRDTNGTSVGTDTLALHADIGNAYVHYESSSPDVSGTVPEPTMLTIGYNMALGRKTLAYFEAVIDDADTGNSDDDATSLYAVLKYDIE
ncbi:MAG: porin [Gammaproteobacteria bacterium]|nr:porin [Gammaproteobacteria bacterium]MDH3450514.1 porin [Gammaproteobacteria bacterium]